MPSERYYAAMREAGRKAKERERAVDEATGAGGRHERRVLVFTRFGKTSDDVTRGLRGEYRIVKVERVAGEERAGLPAWKVYVTER